MKKPYVDYLTSFVYYFKSYVYSIIMLPWKGKVSLYFIILYLLFKC